MELLEPRAKIRLLKDFQPLEGLGVAMVDLKRQISEELALEGVELTQEGMSTVVASVPARNQRQKDRFKELLGKTIRGWKIIDEGSYRLPTTF